MTAWLQCTTCSERFDIGPMFYGCPACKANGKTAPLEVIYALREISANSVCDSAPGLWRWAPLLPGIREESRVSLGEGRTPLLPIGSDVAGLDVAGLNVLLKNETANPTWSWKDRPNCVSVSMAVEFGFAATTAISTGNHGCAAAAYSAAASRNCVIFCHPDAPVSQLALMTSYGANVIRGGDQEALLRQLLERGKHYPCTIYCPRAGYANPFGIEGFKTIAYEINEQLVRSAPDRVFVPAGRGDGIYGVWKGFRELRDLGWIAKAPQMIACQASGADSAFRAFQRKARHAEMLPSTSTVALSIAERITGNHALRAVYESQGSVVICTDDETVRAQRFLMRRGLALEPASAVALACMQRVASEATTGKTWVVVGSGSAVKWGPVIDDFEAPRVFQPDFANIDELSLQ
jgi:threonine synthase